MPSLSTYDFFKLFTTLPHNLIKDKLLELIERIFQRKSSFYITCNGRHTFFTSDAVRNYNFRFVRKCLKFSPFFKTIFILDLARNYIEKW